MASEAVRLHLEGYTGCGFHDKAVLHAKELAKKSGGKLVVTANTVPRDEFRQWVGQESARLGAPHKTSPLVTRNGEYLGGCDDTLQWLKEFEVSVSTSGETVDRHIPENTGEFDYDVVVIGGGSGGMACSKALAGHIQGAKKVCNLDFVKPSPVGTKWGYGGTCVNVGCIPKKLYHTAALHRQTALDSEAYGQVPQAETKARPVHWEKLREEVQLYIKQLNFTSLSELRQAGGEDGGVAYKNALAKFVDPHTIECTNKKGQVEKVTARRFVLAMGGRPKYPDIPGAKEFGITSDDIFSLEKSPGETLVVGASYIALECAGFLTGIGCDTTVLMRSIPLRGFDQEMAEKICDYMQEEGTTFIRGQTPTGVTKLESGRLSVALSGGDAFECDTVLFAMGRTPDTGINLDAAGVKLADSGKVAVDKYDRTSQPHIYSIGDINEGNLELTPVAIQQGRLLASRLFDRGSQLMDLRNVATTVFTPLEYGCCGYSEEDATSRFGAENLEVYHQSFRPLEWNLPNRGDNKCFIKLICNKADSERVVGFHVLAPNAGEITQGIAVAMMCGATKASFDSTVGIHPTVAETYTTMTITKSSGKAAAAGGC
eukprot:TRINITY_DN1851_c1_g1_i4.p1 TRINITY_DN1851_c1_g1~~TRINITY_DN1851_c1_g1_i4.p1  ORF type:complete len:600 (+),score=218.38 TRINITY_DN1851_c1_g1_i4:229-2028(+)